MVNRERLQAAKMPPRQGAVPALGRARGSQGAVEALLVAVEELVRIGPLTSSERAEVWRAVDSLGAFLTLPVRSVPVSSAGLSAGAMAGSGLVYNRWVPPPHFWAAQKPVRIGRCLAPGWAEPEWVEALHRHGNPATVKDLPWDMIFAAVLEAVPTGTPVFTYPHLPSKGAVRTLIQDSGLADSVAWRIDAALVGESVLDLVFTAMAVRFGDLCPSTGVRSARVESMAWFYGALGTHEHAKELLLVAAALWTLRGSWHRVACMARWLYVDRYHPRSSPARVPADRSRSPEGSRAERWARGAGPNPGHW
jgi:hypothetical protein